MQTQSSIQPHLRIIEPTDIITVDHPIFLLFGQPGVGKTSLGFSAENPLLLNFDTESALARAVNRGPAMNVLTIEELRELEEGSDLIEPYATITIDPVGACVNLMQADIISKNPKLGRDGNLTQQGWGVLKNRFRTWTTRMRGMKKNLLFIAHHKEDKNGDTVFVRPDITGASKDEIMRLADFVGFIYMNGRERVLDFNPTDAWFGKNPAQWPAWRVPAPEKARTFMTKLFAEGRAALSRASEASATIAQQVDDWRAAITFYKEIHEFNRAVPQIRRLGPTIQPQVVKIIVDHATSQGLTYDAVKKEFFALQPKQEALVSL